MAFPVGRQGRPQLVQAAAPLLIDELPDDRERVDGVGEARAQAGAGVVLRSALRHVEALLEAGRHGAGEQRRGVHPGPEALLPAHPVHGPGDLRVEEVEIACHQLIEGGVVPRFEDQLHDLGQVHRGGPGAVQLLAHDGGLVAADEDVVAGVLKALAVALQHLNLCGVVDGQDPSAAGLDAFDGLVEEVLRRVIRDSHMELGVNDVHLAVDLEGEIGQLVGLGAKEERLAKELALGLGEELHPEVLEEFLGLVARETSGGQVGRVEVAVEQVEAAHGADRVAVLHLLQLVMEIGKLEGLMEGLRGTLGQGFEGGIGQGRREAPDQDDGGFVDQSDGLVEDAGASRGAVAEAGEAVAEEAAPVGAGVAGVKAGDPRAGDGGRIARELPPLLLLPPLVAKRDEQVVMLELVGEVVVGVHGDAGPGAEQVEEPGPGHDPRFVGVLGAVARKLGGKLVAGEAGGRVVPDVGVLSLQSVAGNIEGLRHRYLLHRASGR